jgi:hypothetical protein
LYYYRTLSAIDNTVPTAIKVIMDDHTTISKASLILCPK